MCFHPNPVYFKTYNSDLFCFASDYCLLLLPMLRSLTGELVTEKTTTQRIVCDRIEIIHQQQERNLTKKIRFIQIYDIIHSTIFLIEFKTKQFESAVFKCLPAYTAHTFCLIRCVLKNTPTQHVHKSPNDSCVCLCVCLWSMGTNENAWVDFCDWHTMGQH